MNIKLPPGIYMRQYKTAAGYTQTLFHPRFVCWDGKRRTFPGIDNIKDAKIELTRLRALNRNKYNFDEDRQRGGADADGARNSKAALLFSEWAKVYPTFDDIKHKRSLPTDLILIEKHLVPFFGAMKLTEITREALNRYIEKRSSSTTIRWGRPSGKKVARGTITNELSLLRRMLNLADRESYKVVVPNFEGLMVRVELHGRELTGEEREKALALYPPSMRRLAIFAREACLSEADLLSLTEAIINAASAFQSGTKWLRIGYKENYYELLSCK